MKKLLIVMVLGASAVAASAQGLQPRRTSGGHLQRQKMLAKAAQRQETVDGFTWSYRVSNGEATIMKLEKGHESCAVSPAPKGHFAIPSTLGGAKVMGIGGYAFSFCGEMTSVTLPDAVKEIGSSAFLGCSGLATMTIPEGVTNIGRQAFAGCEKLKSITIPASVTSIGGGVFEWCRKLSEIKLAEGNQCFAIVDGVLYTKDLSELIMCPNTLTSVKIPSDVRNIGVSSFEGCESLGSITIPEGVTNIGWSAFRYCRKLKSVTIPSRVTNIGQQAFNDCRDLTTVTMLGELPASLNNIFDRCGKLKAIHVPAKCKSWAGRKKWQKLPLVFDDTKTNVKSEGDKVTQGKCVVADKFQGCDFLCNKEFKKDAKFYLCLFSASWCGPCRREMPRIAKTNAETLKDDPDIELIHFSRDQNDEKALAWAKEHDVKFPVVKPKGGNPLDLHSRGIPHLFIVKADGTLVEEGHPMQLFTDEKLQMLKSGNYAPSAGCVTNRQPSRASLPSAKKSDFKAKLTGIAIIEGGNMRGYKNRAENVDFESPNSLIEVPHGKAACFRIEYDFPKDRGANMWPRAKCFLGQDGNKSNFGCNGSGYYTGMGVTYGFLIKHGGKSCTLTQLSLLAGSRFCGAYEEWDVAVEPVHIVFH